MVKKRMAMRMLTIFVALIVCGMFFPGLARGEDLSIDQGLDVDFEDVVIGEDKTIPLQITNQSEHTLTLIPTFAKDADCDFTCFKIVDEEPIQLGVTYLDPGEVLNLKVTFSASDVGLCTAWLDIMYTGSPGGAVRIDFTANGIEEVTQTLGPIVVGRFTTRVMDRTITREGSAPTTLAEIIGECDEDSDRRGEFVSCVARATGELMREGLVKRDERQELVRYATRLEWERIIEKMRAHKRSHRGGGPWWWVHRH